MSPGWVGGAGARSVAFDGAPVSQPAEEAVSNTVQCGFESHPGHSRQR